MTIPKAKPGNEGAFRVVGPAEMGWIPRPDLGPRVWELPTGGLHTFGEGEKIRMLMFDGLEDWQIGTEHIEE